MLNAWPEKQCLSRKVLKIQRSRLILHQALDIAVTWWWKDGVVIHIMLYMYIILYNSNTNTYATYLYVYVRVHICASFKLILIKYIVHYCVHVVKFSHMFHMQTLAYVSIALTQYTSFSKKYFLFHILYK